MFRKQAIDYHGKKLLGEVSLTQPFSIYTPVLVILTFIILLLIFLFNSNYSRKETVKGYLVPNSGLIKIYPNRSGTLDTLFISDGKIVKKGDILAKVVLSRPQVNGIDLSKNVISTLEQQVKLLNRDLKETESLMKREVKALKTKHKYLQSSVENLDKKIQLLERKHQIHRNEYQHYQHLSKKNFISKIDVQKKEQELLHSKEALLNAVTSKLSMLTQINDINYNIDKIPHELKLRITNILKETSVLDRKINEAKNNYTFSIIAKDSGVVTAISAKEGEHLSINRPLLSIIPIDEELVAELFFPTRSAGFVQKNDEARLRFEAFPYQRFGFITGTVTRIDKSTVVNNELDVPVILDEPVYRVQVKLERQSIKAYGEKFPLKTGMLLEADIILEKRSLFQWLLDPIYSLRGRVG
ncbi:Secretion Protein [Vibrio sp. B1REV9]|uniref:HlyD family secretion protein n=1 Tax=Vibrio sp. B1REV9 TaxID=2751179 RepID=UPI001AF93882|nr:HlyD family efflux transporter periplasmic adaptor subunit [Vibrio sp. B1REV9]CAE6931306.1 Secretion Protein [Vibrio sp. B1REV9]